MSNPRHMRVKTASSNKTTEQKYHQVKENRFSNKEKYSTQIQQHKRYGENLSNSRTRKNILGLQQQLIQPKKY